jgi:hypothetical protein
MGRTGFDALGFGAGATGRALGRVDRLFGLAPNEKTQPTRRVND